MSFVHVGLTALAVSALLVMLMWTAITDTSHLTNDFPMDSWLMQHQADALRHGTFPSLTLTSPWAAFYPVFAFYGGTLFAFGGALAALTGSSDAAEIAVYLLALAAAYGGWLWLARMAGVRSWPAHAPAIVYVTAPYVITNINVRQDLAELVAGAVIPLLLASALSVLRAERLHAGPAVALAASTIVFGGAHNLTLLWGTTVLAIAAVVVVSGVPEARRLVNRRGVLRLLAVVVPAMAVNGWYLLPDLAYHSDTVIAQRIDEWKALLRGQHPELATKNLFALGHPTAFPGSGMVITLPVIAIAWVVVAAAATRAQWQTVWGRVLALLSVLTVVVLMAMTHPRWILALPDPWQLIQFSYRLETFALFGICAAMIAAAVLAQHSPHRWLTALLLPLLIFSIISAAVQRHDAPRGKVRLVTGIDRFGAFSIGDFADATVRQHFPRSTPSVLRVTRAGIYRGRVEGDVITDPEGLIYTYLLTPAKLLDVQGARILGSWPAPPLNKGWQTRWALVLQSDGDVKPGEKAHIAIREAHTAPIVGGRIISILGLIGLAANAGVIARRRLVRRV
jgi:hypothetical protein